MQADAIATTTIETTTDAVQQVPSTDTTNTAPDAAPARKRRIVPKPKLQTQAVLERYEGLAANSQPILPTDESGINDDDDDTDVLAKIFASNAVVGDDAPTTETVGDSTAPPGEKK